MARFAIFAPRTFLLALVLALLGVVLGGMVPLLGSLGRFLGIFVAASIVGLGRPGRHYVETAAAGALAAGLGFALPDLGLLLGAAGFGFLPGVAVATAGVGITSAALVSVVGHYVGRDLRAGLTREIS